MKDLTSEDNMSENPEAPYGGAAYGYVRRGSNSTGTAGGLSYGECLSLTHPEEKHSAFNEANTNRNVEFDWPNLHAALADSYDCQKRVGEKVLFKSRLFDSFLNASAAYLIFSPSGEHLRAGKVFQNVEAAARNVRRAAALDYSPEDMGVLKKFGLIYSRDLGGYIGDVPLFETPLNATLGVRLSAALNAFWVALDRRESFVDSIAYEMISPLGFRIDKRPVRLHSRDLTLDFNLGGRAKFVSGLKKLPPLVVLTALQNKLSRRGAYTVTSTNEPPA